MVNVTTKQGSRSYLVTQSDSNGVVRKAFATINPLRAFNTAREWAWKASCGAHHQN